MKEIEEPFEKNQVDLYQLKSLGTYVIVWCADWLFGDGLQTQSDAIGTHLQSGSLCYLVN